MKRRKSRKAVNNENKCIQSAVKSFTRVYTIVRPLTQNLAKTPPPNNSIQQSGQQQQALKWKTSTDIIFEGSEFIVIVGSKSGSRSFCS